MKPFNLTTNKIFLSILIVFTVNAHNFVHNSSPVHDLIDNLISKTLRFKKQNDLTVTRMRQNLLSNDYKDFENDCLGLFIELSNASSSFLSCASKSSRPFSVCQTCIKHYLEAQYIYNLILADTNKYATSLYEYGLTCKEIVEATNKVQTEVKIFDVMNTIWGSSNCDSCFESYSYDTFNYTIKDSIKQFNESQAAFRDCIFNFTHSCPSVDPLFQNYTQNATLCQKCKHFYENMTHSFSTILTGDVDENSVCMDMVDLFNYTRIAWSKGYKCNYRDIDEYSILIIGITFTLATICFYILVRVVNTKEEIQFAKITNQRRSFVTNPDMAVN